MRRRRPTPSVGVGGYLDGRPSRWSPSPAAGTVRRRSSRLAAGATAWVVEEVSLGRTGEPSGRRPEWRVERGGGSVLHHAERLGPAGRVGERRRRGPVPPPRDRGRRRHPGRRRPAHARDRRRRRRRAGRRRRTPGSSLVAASSRPVARGRCAARARPIRPGSVTSTSAQVGRRVGEAERHARAAPRRRRRGRTGGTRRRGAARPSRPPRTTAPARRRGVPRSLAGAGSRSPAPCARRRVRRSPTPIPVSAASNRDASPRHPRRPSARRWSTKRWPPKSRSGAHGGGRQRRCRARRIVGCSAGAADLEHLQPRRALEHAVADVRRLQHGVAGVEHERRPLVLVDDAGPSRARSG